MAPVVRPFSGRTAMHPNAPPTEEISKASSTKENTTLAAPNPSARIVAISRERSATAESYPVSQLQTGIAMHRILSDHEFIQAWLEKTAGNDFYFLMNQRRLRRYAADLHVGIGARRLHGEGGNNHHFRTHQRSIGRAGDTGSIFQDLLLIELNNAVHLRGR